jgi:hypothetical protein
MNVVILLLRSQKNIYFIIIMDIEKFIKDARKSKLPYIQPGKQIDPIDTSNIPDDEPYTLEMVGYVVDKYGKKLVERTRTKKNK